MSSIQLYRNHGKERRCGNFELRAPYEKLAIIALLRDILQRDHCDSACVQWFWPTIMIKLPSKSIFNARFVLSVNK